MPHHGAARSGLRRDGGAPIAKIELRPIGWLLASASYRHRAIVCRIRAPPTLTPLGSSWRLGQRRTATQGEQLAVWLAEWHCALESQGSIG